MGTTSREWVQAPYNTFQWGVGSVGVFARGMTSGSALHVVVKLASISHGMTRLLHHKCKVYKSGVSSELLCRVSSAQFMQVVIWWHGVERDWIANLYRENQ